MLFAAQFTYNNSTQAFTEISLFQAKYDRDMQINDEMIKSKENDKQAIQQNKKMQQIHEQLRKNLQFVYERIKIYYNLQHENISMFRTEQKIYLSQENFKTK